jgi:hypothetical protein
MEEAFQFRKAYIYTSVGKDALTRSVLLKG